MFCLRRFDSDDKEVNSVTEIPGDAKMLANQFPGVVKVLAPRKDFGPASKLLPTLEVETDPETIIITVDVSACCCRLCWWQLLLPLSSAARCCHVQPAACVTAT